MIINEILGNLNTTNIGNKNIDYIDFEWYETNKKIQRKTSREGQEIAIKFLKEGQRLKEGDILFENEQKIVAVNIVETEAIIITPKTMLEMGAVCYEIGNKHIPLFIQDDKVLLPFEMPMFRWLQATGYNATKDNVKLLNILKSNVEPHGHGHSHHHEHQHGHHHHHNEHHEHHHHNDDTIFSKIMKMNTQNDE